MLRAMDKLAETPLALASHIWVNTGSGNGLLASATSPYLNTTLTKICDIIWHNYATSYFKATAKSTHKKNVSGTLPLNLVRICCKFFHMYSLRFYTHKKKQI